MFYSASACFLPDMVLTSYMPVPETNGEEWDRLKAATKENVEEGRLNVLRDVVSVLVALDADACRGKLQDCMGPAIWGASQCTVIGMGVAGIVIEPLLPFLVRLQFDVI